MTKLSVNINKLATLRNARGPHAAPNLLEWAKKIQSYGAHGITVHPRPDERHIKKQDVLSLKPLIHTEFNIEGFPSSDFVELVQKVRPHQCTLVPDPPHVLTSNAGWKVTENQNVLKEVGKQLKSHCRISVFMEPGTFTLEEAKALKNMGVSRAELYTENFSLNHTNQNILKKYRQAADILLKAGLELNAGHDLNLENLDTLTKWIPEIKEVSIGHALICESLEYGMKSTILRYLDILNS